MHSTIHVHPSPKLEKRHSVRLCILLLHFFWKDLCRRIPLSFFSCVQVFGGFFWGGRGNLGVSSKEARLHVACWWRILWPCNDIPPKRNKVYVQHKSDSYSIIESIDKYIFYSFWAWCENDASSRRAWLWKFTSVRKNLKITLQWNVLLATTPLSGDTSFYSQKNWSLAPLKILFICHHIG